jgi:DNA-binding transcriptional ArsR family regulator
VTTGTTNGPTDLARVQTFDIVRALADRTRWAIVRQLWETPEKACGTFGVDVSASTLTHHFAVLREAGVISQRPEGNRKMTTLRAEDLEARFPGLLGALMEEGG